MYSTMTSKTMQDKDLLVWGHFVLCLMNGCSIDFFFHFLSFNTDIFLSMNALYSEVCHFYLLQVGETINGLL